MKNCPDSQDSDMPPPQSDYQGFYDRIAHDYHRSRYGTRYGRLFRALHQGALGELLTALPAGAFALEVACGTGHTTELLRDRRIEFIACDLTPNMLQELRERVGIDLRLVRSDAMCLPFADASFDLVVSTRFMHLFEPVHQKRLLLEMHRVLRPGGRLIVNFDHFTSRWLLAVPHLAYNLIRYRRLAPDTHYNRIAQTERLLTDCGFTQIDSIGIGGYHLIVPALYSPALALRWGIRHQHSPWRWLAEQFVCTGLRR